MNEQTPGRERRVLRGTRTAGNWPLAPPRMIW